MSSEDQEAQEDELLALASIYHEEEFRRAESAQGGEIRVCLQLPQDFNIFVSGQDQHGLEKDRVEHTVSFLPPVVLNFELPSDYPSTSSPIFTLSCKWLPKIQLSAVCKHLDDLWQESVGSVVLFSWMQFLKEDLLTFLNIESPLEIKNPSEGRQKKNELDDVHSNAKEEPLDPRAIQDLDCRISILPQILDFDQTQQQKAFDNKAYVCGICFSEKMGAECLGFKECKHVYCKACLKEYFQIQIRDGNVQCLNCPEPKCTSVATPAQVKDLVGEELFARYDRLLLQSSLDMMADVVYCPRRICETAVMLEPGCTMGICSGCKYAFCTLCKLAYHGVSPCSTTAEQLRGLRDEYLGSTDEGKKFLEQRFGKRVIQKAVEESHSQDWLEKNSKACPRCGTHIQKVDGCNKMTCINCHQYFCWLCMCQLSRANPYGHFNNSTMPCFNRLFQGVDIEDGAFWSDEEDEDD
ncbi:E3 ubiquitin-protein ligase RNF14-like isoform X1 [Acipenser oxyrinchus oxyrinchus]|uniref:E3 ubiquitin-protein ligase RNF14 n=1 Tax=Acipenser oxyrinchus oxyrinchus TaxID=40147 RepID=A0AAD8D2B8_ACIOX|nr:E3 ubiquitin-protein ligase RNF14-like isoform X1 [Acipenser oxyrinchus oxyrinchus]